MSITVTAHNKNSLWTFLDSSYEGPSWNSVPVGQTSTASRIVCNFQFEGQAVSVVLTGVFPENASTFSTLGSLASQNGVMVTGYELSLGGSLVESASMTQGVGLTLLLSALTSTNRSSLQELYSGDDTFLGTRSSQVGGEDDDGVNGYAGNDVFIGYSNSGSTSNTDKFFGGDGIDTMVFQGRRSEYSVSSITHVWMPDGLEGSGRRITDGVAGRDGTKTERYVEHLQFSDMKLALNDNDNSAQKTLQFIGVIAPALQGDLSVRGAILSLFEQGRQMEDLCQLALDLGLITSDNTALARTVYRNVFNTTTDPDQGVTNSLVAYIEQHGDANFLATVAGLNINVDVVGLQQNGMAFL